MSDKFIHLSTVSDFSLLTGASKVEDYILRAKVLGMGAVGFTEIGSLRGFYEAQKQANEHGIKPIFGVTVYVTRDMSKKGLTKEQKAKVTEGVMAHEHAERIAEYEREHGYMGSERDLTTLTLWALNDKGLRNLYELTTRSWLQGFYYKPRVDLDAICELSEGVAVGTGGPGSAVNSPALAGKRREALDVAQKLYDTFGERMYLEIRPHKLLEQSKANKFAIKLADKLPNAKLLATNASHYVSEGDLKYQKMLANIGNPRSELSIAGLPIDSYFFRSHAQMLKAFEDLGVDRGLADEACRETVNFAERCTAKIEFDPFALIMPDLGFDDVDEELEMLANSCLDNSDPAYQERLDRELKTLKELKFSGYILYVVQILDMCREMDIPIGPGRGSAAGSLVNYVLGITDVDPIEHKLSFERFVAPGRVNPPDIDVDIDGERRADLVAAMQERWGKESVAQISTFGLLRGKVAINDVGRSLKVPSYLCNEVTMLVDVKRKSSDPRFFMTAIDAFANEGLTRSDSGKLLKEEYPDLEIYAAKIEGLTRQVGVHPAGIVCSPGPLHNFIPLEKRKDSKSGEDLVVTAWDMGGVEALGLQKVDMLGLNTVNTLDKADREIRKSNPNFHLADVPLDDAKTLAAFTAQDFGGVFQYDSVSAKNLCKGVTFDSFGAVSDMTALNRPGPLDSGMATEYVKRKADPSLIEMDYHEIVSRITKDTLGVMIYQEQIMYIAAELAGYENPDALRKKIAKSKGLAALQEEWPKFWEGCQAKDMTEEAAQKLFNDICTFGRYGFNKSHSVSYAKIGYFCQYLKVHHTLEFYWALILTESKKSKMSSFARDAKAHGIKLLPPDVSKSSDVLSIDREENAIRGAIIDINGVGPAAAKAIVANQPYESFDDFYNRTPRRGVNSGAIKALAQAGALGDLIPNTKWFVENADEFFHKAKLKKWTSWADAFEEAADMGVDWTDEERLVMQTIVNPMSLENPYTQLLGRLSIQPADFTDEHFFAEYNGRACWVTGTLGELRHAENVEYKDETFSEAKKKHYSYGKQLVNAQLQSDSGGSVGIKIGWNVFEHCKEAAEDGTPILAYVVPLGRWSKLYAEVVIPLENLRTGEHKSVWSDIAYGKHPAIMREYTSQRERQIAVADLEAMKQRGFAGEFDVMPVLGVICSVQPKVTKKGDEMAIVGFMGHDGFVKASFFPRSWQNLKERLKVGKFVRVDLEVNSWNGGKSFIYGDGEFRVLG